MFCRHVFGNISGGFRGISRKYLNFAGPRPREISEALNIALKYNKINHSMAFVPASGITKRKPEKARSIIKFYKIYEIFIMTLKVQS